MPSIQPIQWTLPQDWQEGRWVFCKCPIQLSYCSLSARMASRKILSPKLWNKMRLTYQYSKQRSACKNTFLMWISFTTPLNILTRGSTFRGLLPSAHSLEKPQTLPQVHLNQLSNLAKVDETSPPRDVPWNGACKKQKDHERKRKWYEHQRHQQEPFASVLRQFISELVDEPIPTLQIRSGIPASHHLFAESAGHRWSTNASELVWWQPCGGVRGIGMTHKSHRSLIWPVMRNPICGCNSCEVLHWPKMSAQTLSWLPPKGTTF